MRHKWMMLVCLLSFKVQALEYEIQPENDANKEKIMENFSAFELSNYVTIVFTVPETHANAMRETMARAGAGKLGDYSHCSYSLKGIGRFMPNKGANPYLGKEEVIEEVVEERIETVCNLSVLEHVLKEIKEAHPYEEAVIDIYPVYEIGLKRANNSPS